MGTGLILLLEISFVELLIFLLLLISISKSKSKKTEDYGEPSKSTPEKKGFPYELKHPKIIKKKEAEFKRFLIILISLIIIGYLMISDYLGVSFNFLVLILIILGVFIVSIFIFVEMMRKYK